MSKYKTAIQKEEIDNENKDKIYKEELNKRSRGTKHLILIFFSFISIIVFTALYNYEFLKKLNYFDQSIKYILFLSVLGAILTYKMIPPFMQIFLKKKHFGIDINKVADIKDLSDPNRKEVPETLGLVPAVGFLVISILYQMTNILDKAEALKFSSTLISICFMAFLGFVDDMVDLRWRYKLVLPTVASIPIVLAYSPEVDFIPNILVKLFSIINIDNIFMIGCAYKVYITLLSVFCTNAINIYAGINGLEVGQSIVITISLIVYNIIEISSNVQNNNANGNLSNNLDSLSLLIMFLFVTLPLFLYNKYPSKCFIGDTFCYFAGITLACSAIIGSFGITLLLFFIPQIINFLLSIPQLIGIIPCPRHRLPTYNPTTYYLHSKPDQLNLLNQGLRVLGPTREQDLCNIAIIFQAICSVIAFSIKYYFYPLLEKLIMGN